MFWRVVCIEETFAVLEIEGDESDDFEINARDVYEVYTHGRNTAEARLRVLVARPEATVISMSRVGLWEYIKGLCIHNVYVIFGIELKRARRNREWTD